MNEVGFVFEVKNDQIVVDYLASKWLEIASHEFKVDDGKNYENGEILVLANISSNEKIDCIYRSSLDGNDFSKINLDEFLNHLSILLTKEYQRYIKYTDIENKIKKKGLEALPILESHGYEELLRKIIYACEAINNLLTNLRKLNILQDVLKLAKLKEKEVGIEYQKVKKFMEINLTDETSKEEPLTRFQKIKRVLNRTKKG